MIDFIKKKIAAGCVPTWYNRRPTVFGTESTFRWREYFNSKSESVKLDFNIQDPEHEEIVALVTPLLYRGANKKF